ncbi:P-loop containing nucleoside triphosphate hydrolase protein [Xylaria sp. FL0933]|nr:P-loop containing nucleoside triphosphate hydrolase protein [Xylaria sp. FL0933]
MEDQRPIAGPEYTDELEIIQSHIKFSHLESADIPEWRTYPEIPTSRDLNPNWEDPEDLERIHSLLPNNWDHAFPDKNTYLETHYRLQREEAISLLRYSIKKYREEPNMADDDDTCVYTKVFVQGYLMTRLGPMCRIQFSTEKAGKRIRWTQTRRLTTGSLVVISTAEDGFKTICMPAIIAEHSVEGGLDQTPPMIQIFWANMNDAIWDPTTELVMLETRCGYFEAVRHCMVGLQHVASVDTPLDKYLVNLDQSDLTAQYVREDPRMNIASLIHHIPGSGTLPTETVRQLLAERRESLRRYEVLHGINDQISSYTNLDNSQLSAVHRILTKELAIIQGPPGTGKTFTSVQALQILLDSQQERGKNVIIVAAQTNHAVDQILSQLIDLGFCTVRLGGRTQNEDIKRYSLYNLRRHVMPARWPKSDREYRRLEAERKRTIAQLEELAAGIFSDELINPQALLAAGIITQKQSESLLAEDGWACASSLEESSGSLSQWLGDQQVEAPSMYARDPDFDIQEDDEMVDFDAEDYDMDLDDCIADDDKVDGRWVPTKYQWTGANPRQYTEADLVIRKELKRDNLWDISEQYRGAIYQYWQRELLRLHCAKFRAELVANARICKELKANKWHRDLRCIKMAGIEIIGCTTTGLCKYRGLLAALKPRTMLIEEAAETKEASILSALYPSLQQLILVGDHQQLAPSCDTPFLDEAPYFIRVSMFERLVKMGMPYTMLNMQRRMHPILREVLSPFYPDLRDHPVVCKPDARRPIPGMGQLQSFFFHHTWSEGTDENLSKFNILEAEMIVRFIDYLMMNGVKGTEITVLTFYRGQRKKILSEFRKLEHREPFRNVQTVDSYQGEENDIVILSLVRSNGTAGPHRAGFLRDSNRGVVAISRARRGFYIFGNVINLLNACVESQMMWGQVYDVFCRQNRFSYDGGLPITCQKHQNPTCINHPDEWINNHGGCDKPCGEKFDKCGHDCVLRCHWVEHSRLICMEACQKVLRCGHPCELQCGVDCYCQCDGYTGAYANDEAWDDDTIQGDSSQSSTVSRGTPAPFIGSDGRVGKIRGSRNGSRNYRGGFARGRPARTAEQFRAQGSSVRLHMLSQGWANFDGRQHDEQQRQRNRRAVENPNPLHSSISDDQATFNMVNPIQETFRQVTLNPHGRRDVKKGVVSKSQTPSPEKAQNSQVSNDNSPKQVYSTGEPPKFNSAVHAGDLMFPNPIESLSREEVNSSASRHLGELNRHSSSNVWSYPAYAQHTMASQQAVPRTVMRTANRVRPAEDRAEWEITSTVCETQDGNLDLGHATEAEEGNLIEL